MKETYQRIISGLVLALLYIFLIFFDDFYYIQSYLIGILFFILALKEFYIFSNRKEEGSIFFKASVFWGIIILSLFYLDLAIQKNYFFVENLKTLNFSPILFVVFIFLLSFLHFSFLQIFTRTLKGAIFSTASSLLAIFYLSVLIGHFFSFLAIEGGVYFIVLVSVITIFTDVGAYFGGKFFGKNLAGILTSPKKTLEGYFTGIVVGISSAFILNYIWSSILKKDIFIHSKELFFLAFILSLLGILGDLLESAMKRDANVKDSSSIIPGHGGILDLLDAMFVTLPFLYYYIKIKDIFF